MKKIIIVFFTAFVLYACGGKQAEEQTLTEAEETQMVQEASEELNSRVKDISTQADSLNHAVDSLLKTIK